MEKNKDFLFDKAKGCFLGSLIGNAIGAYLDKQIKPLPKDIELAMKYPGGGVHKVGVGQITDDGELQMCLARGLVEGKGILNLYAIAKEYGQWFLSQPINIGETLKNAISKARKMNEHSIELETTLTHPNETVIQVNQFYALAIAHLLNNENDRKEAFNSAKEYLLKSCNKEFIQWISDLEQNKELEKTKNLGFVKIAFFHAFKFLLNGLNFADAIKATLQEGGDTDTNCCIVGALVGAAEGFEAIPKDLITPVLSWKIKKGDYKRPDELNPTYHFEDLMKKLMECCPKKLEVSCLKIK